MVHVPLGIIVCDKSQLKRDRTTETTHKSLPNQLTVTRAYRERTVLSRGSSDARITQKNVKISKTQKKVIIK